MPILKQSLTLRFQSTLPVRGATLLQVLQGDPPPISIHAPREGSDGKEDASGIKLAIFQSTLPVRGATPGAADKGLSTMNFNPRSP